MFWSSEDRVRVPFHGTFSRHGRIKASFILLIWLNENVPFHAPFLAMAELKRALFCSSGLTKTLDFILRFSSFVYRFIPTSLVSPFQFPCSSHFVPSSPAWFWDLMRIHWWLTEELPTSVCGRNVQCDEWFSLEPRCKDSANRVECKRETRFSFHFRGAAYLGRQCKGMKKNNRLFHLSPTCDGNVANLLHLHVYQYVTKHNFGALNMVIVVYCWI